MEKEDRATPKGNMLQPTDKRRFMSSFPVLFFLPTARNVLDRSEEMVFNSRDLHDCPLLRYEHLLVS